MPVISNPANKNPGAILRFVFCFVTNYQLAGKFEMRDGRWQKMVVVVSWLIPGLKLFQLSQFALSAFCDLCGKRDNGLSSRAN